MSTERGHSLVELSELGLDPGVPKQELRRLITPKSVCEYRAMLASKASLPEGSFWIQLLVRADSSSPMANTSASTV